MSAKAFAVLISVIAAAAAQAQLTTREVEIVLTDPACMNVRSVFVVMDGDDANAVAAAKKPQPCRWSFTSPFGTFSTALTHFSLRMGIARTRCRKATAAESAAAAQLTLRCCERGAVRQLAIDADVPVPYVREVPGDDPDVACLEDGLLPATVRDVQFSVERVRLQLFDTRAPACGLVLNRLAPLQNAGRGATVPLDTEETVAALMRQANAGEDCSAPTLSGASIDIAEEALRRRGLKSLSVTVH